MGLIRSVVLFIFLSDYFNLSFSLKLNETGVCSVRLSSTKTRLKPYWVTMNKMCGKKKCTQKKTKLEKYTTLTDRLVCCTGWEYKSAEDVCVPQCSGCLQGQCLGPDLCRCDPPLTLDPTTKNCITPQCEITCVNSHCNLSKECVCNTDFIKHNSTHCAPKCDDRFKLDEAKLICEPVCGNCINGICSEPDKCNCNKGYKLNDGLCKPNCEPECENGDCVEPNTCICREGFVLSKDKVKCEVEEICKEGFSKVNGECEPKCEEFCDKEVCFGEESEFNASLVIPKDCYSGCSVNCSDEHKSTFCTIIRRGTKSKKTSYICCEGYQYVRNTNTCKPQCRRGCDGGTCVNPDVCQCDLPLVLNGDGNQCIEPKCETPCTNGVCVNTNTCECNNGFIHINDTHCGEECEDGFEHDKNLNCQPICNPTCTNGKCIGPNECDCDDGYEIYEEETNCEPICDPECVNAECVAPNTCTCRKGYNETHVNYKCEPICDKECQNGYCIAPNRCHCDPGYIQDQIDELKCIPHCKPECINGECRGPDFCSCFTDFELSSDKWICKPKCERCYNGTCSAPNDCVCDEGYKLEEGSCIPICNRSCNNGYCSSPDFCTCYDGYKAGSDSSMCYKPCEPPCAGGSCSQHGICTCADGYIMKNYTCTLVTTTNLKMTKIDCKGCNGSCIQADSCSCADGSSCHVAPDDPAEVQSPKMAGMEVTWLVGGAIGVLLLTLVIITIERLWRKKKEHAETDKPQQLGSVMYSVSVPDTLIRANEYRKTDENEPIEEENGNEDVIAMTSIPLLDENTKRNNDINQ